MYTVKVYRGFESHPLLQERDFNYLKYRIFSFEIKPIQVKVAIQ